MKGKYLLDIIDDTLYSTDIYSIYYWYNILFYDYDVSIEENIPIEREYLDNVFHGSANKETWNNALKNEFSYYENGYVYKSEWIKIRKIKMKKGRWIKDPVNAYIIFNKIKQKYSENRINSGFTNILLGNEKIIEVVK